MTNVYLKNGLASMFEYTSDKLNNCFMIETSWKDTKSTPYIIVHLFDNVYSFIFNKLFC